MPGEIPQNIPFFNSSLLLKKYNSIDKINSFLEEIISANRKINIVSRETSREKLFQLSANCLMPLEFISSIKGKIFDIGPGAGFPSVVLMLARPDLEATLIERTGKKARFLKSMVSKYDLRGTVIDLDLSDAVNVIKIDRFDFGFMKYVRLDRKILKSAMSLLKPGGKFIYYSNLDQKQLSIIDDLNPDKVNYYLDDNKRVRTLTIFSPNN